MEIIRFPQAFSALACHERYFFDEKVKAFINLNYSLVHREELLVQCLLLGDESVGKSTLVDSFTRNDFKINRRPTSGIIATRSRFTILGLPFDLNILDAAGSLRLEVLKPEYYEKIHSILFVFDMDKLETLRNLAHWYDGVIDASRLQKNSLPLLFVVGTHRDLLSQRQIEIAEIEATSFANDIGAEFWSVSSATQSYDASLIELFCRVATLSFEEAVTRKYRQDMISVIMNSHEECIRKKSTKKNLQKVGSRILRCCNRLLRRSRCKKCDLQKMRK